MTDRVPPFAALRAFDAAARHLSFKAAAAELGVTPTAVSHQIRHLEQAADQRLFVRKSRQVELTPQGKAFARDLAPALEAIGQAFATLAAGSGRRTITLGSGPIFASRWLVPRLPEFWAAHPGIDLNLHHSPMPVWQQLGAYDLAVAWGSGDWPGMRSEALMSITVTPVYSPLLGTTGSGVTRPKDLLRFPLLHHRTPSGWREWFEAVGVTPPADMPGITIEDANVVLQAALSGRGVALGILEFIGDDLATGRLVRPFDAEISPSEKYFLVSRAAGSRDARVEAVYDWLIASTQ